VQLQPHVFGVAARRGRRRELHVAPGFEVLDHPRLEGLDPLAVSLDPRLAEGLLVLDAGDEGGETGLDLLPHQLGLVVGVEVAELQHNRGEPRHPARLPGPEPLEEVQHALGGHAARDQRPLAVAGMRRIEPIGPAAAERVELDALQDEAAVAELLCPGAVEVIGFQHLQLQRHGQAVLDPALAEADQHLAALDEASGYQRLQPGEVGEAVGVGRGGEGGPEPVGLGRQLRRRRPSPRLQAGADEVADERRHRLGGVGVVADEIARAVAEPGDRRGDLGVGASTGGDPALGAAAEPRALVGAGKDGDRLPLPGTAQPGARRHGADGAVEPVHGVTRC
jgi:hypothetical protein